MRFKKKILSFPSFQGGSTAENKEQKSGIFEKKQLWVFFCQFHEDCAYIYQIKYKKSKLRLNEMASAMQGF